VFIAIALLFLTPAYYHLKARGYRPAPFLWPAVLVSALFYAACILLRNEPYWILQEPLAMNAAFLLPGVAVLALSWILPRRKGAPGLSYLRIEFTCPHCRRPVTFRREDEGRVELCPLCGEIVTVPVGASPTQPSPRPPPVGEPAEGPAEGARDFHK
jgi:hypothetical protein